MSGKNRKFTIQRQIDFIQIILIFSGFLTVQGTTVQQAVKLIEGVTDGMIKLPCMVAEIGPHNKPRLILWYKDGARRPFFTLDLRSGFPENIVDPVIKERVSSDVMGQWLTVRPLIADDTAQYKCQVDYNNSPTLFTLVNLTVYEPPSKLVIQDEKKRIIPSEVFGPLLQDSMLILFCTATGGLPPPKISWWSDSNLLWNKRLTSNSHLSSQEETVGTKHVGSMSHFDLNDRITSSKVVSTFKIKKLSREYAGRNITCKAENNNITSPLTQSVSLNIYLKPSSVQIIYPKTKLKEGVQTTFECLAKGSNPPAEINWSKTTGGQTQELKSKMIRKNINSMSSLVFKPTYLDHGSSLTCKAQNPEVVNGGLKQTTILRVNFAPRVNLSLGMALTKSAIREGDDVYFDCYIRSNPKSKDVKWHKDGKIIYQDLKSGVLVSDRNLVLQRINKRYTGNYTCTAINDLGSATSNTIELPIMFLPVCNTRQATVSVTEGGSVSLKCNVKANPSKNLNFIWSFNNTLDTVEVSSKKIEVNGTSSILHYTPLTPRDYGMLSCWATNEVGVQAEPCRFGVVEEGPPERVKDCILVNLTGGALDVKCSSGNKSGTAQKFVAKVYSSPNHKLVRVLERKKPQFHVADLTPGMDYLVTITAVNDKGTSDVEEIDAIRLKVAEKRMGEVVSPPLSPLVGVFLGLVGGFVLLLTVGLFLTKARSNRNICWKDDTSNSPKPSEAMLTISEMGITDMSKMDTISNIGSFQHLRLETSKNCFIEEEEDGPDIVKSSNETSQLIASRACPDMMVRKGNYGSGVMMDFPEASPMSPELVAASAMKCQSYRDIQSPIKLPSHESFV